MILTKLSQTSRRNWLNHVHYIRCSYATISSTPAAPPMLLKLRSDMKAAMKAKDTNRYLQHISMHDKLDLCTDFLLMDRLNVLRALLAETANASKTSSPIKTDIELLSLLRKQTAASRSAAEQFSAANRNDLRDKEVAQIAVLEEYASGVDTLGEDEIKIVVAEAIGKMRTEGQAVNAGTVMKAVVGTGGQLKGRPVEKGEVATIVKAML